MNRIIASSIVVLSLAAGAQADLTAFVTVSVSSSQGTANWHCTATPTFDADGNAVWNWVQPTSGGGWNGSMSGANGTVATVNLLQTHYVADPIVNLNFSITAGLAPTIVTITSGVLSFPTIPAAEARATSSVTLTESDGNTASLTGDPLLGGNMYLATLNGFAGAYGGTFFATQIGSFAEPIAFDGEVRSDVLGFLPVGAVSSMSSMFSFTLSANDQASGTSSFVVREIPAPSAAALMGLGALALGRRRR